MFSLGLSFLTVTAIATPLNSKNPGARVQIRAPHLKATSLVIQPRKEAAPLSNMPGFRYVYEQKRLALVFAPGKPGWTLRRSPPFAIQLEMPDEINIEPSMITLEDWPAKAPKMFLKFSGAIKSRPYPLKGRAVFNACNAARKCQVFKTPFEFVWVP